MFKNLSEAIYNYPSIYKKIDLHIVLGSGLAGALDEALLALNKKKDVWVVAGEVPFDHLQEIPQTTVQGHKGAFKILHHLPTQSNVVMQTGRLHGYEGHDPKIVVQPLYETIDMGCKNYLLTNAAGSLQKTWPAGSAMIIQDQVNLTGKNPLCGSNPKTNLSVERGPRFPDMSEAFCKTLNSRLKNSLKKNCLRTFEGTYLGVLGPSFETPAEIRLFAKWGLGAVGMSTVWESIALNHAGARVAGVSFLSNLGAGLSKKPLSHEEVLETGKKSAAKMMLSIMDFSSTFLQSLVSTPSKPSKKPAQAKASTRSKK